MMYTFSTIAQAQEFLALDVQRSLQADILELGYASLILTGGRSIQHFLPSLSEIDLAWNKVHVSLTDERLVDTKSPDSNEGMIQRYFMIRPGPSQAKFLSPRVDS